MDSFTHVFLGGCLGQWSLGKKAGRKAVWWGALADTVPDFDVFAGPFVHPAEALLIHRGFTHSIFFAALFPLVLGPLLARWYRKNEIPWWQWTGLLALGTFSHIFIDSLTTYGTGLLEPFCDHRFTYATLFIIDPAFTLPMFVGFCLLLFKRFSVPFKNKVAKGALILSAIYLAWTFYNRFHFEGLFRDQLGKQNLVYRDQFLSPGPLNNILWSTMARSDSGFYQGFSSYFDAPGPVRFNYIPAQKSLAIPWVQNREYQLLEKFSQGYSCISILDDGLPYFHDLRFGTMYGWATDPGDFAFSYPLQQDPSDSSRLIRAGAWGRAEFEGFGGLWKRILGKK